MKLTPEAGDLIWLDWDDAYIVYQPSSSETHVFNETTALILESLKQGPSSMEGVRNRIVEEMDDLASDDLNLAVIRLEELGIIECSDESAPSP